MPLLFKSQSYTEKISKLTWDFDLTFLSLQVFTKLGGKVRTFLVDKRYFQNVFFLCVLFDITVSVSGDKLPLYWVGLQYVFSQRENTKLLHYKNTK